MAQVSTTGIAVSRDHPVKGERSAIALISLAVLYFMLGFITCLNDTLVPFFKRSFTLTYAESSLVQFYFFLTYGLFSIPAGKIISRIGYQKGMIAGFLLSAAGALLFLPAAVFHLYYFFLAALFVLAIGIVFMQVAANPYIVILGAPETASSRLNLIQSVGSAGTILAPVFGAAFILPKLDLSMSSGAVILPYLGIAIVLIAISVVVGRLRLPKVHLQGESGKGKTGTGMRVEGVRISEGRGAGLVEATTSAGAALSGRARSAWSFRNLNLGAIGIFFSVGIEVAIASFLTNYISDTLGIREEAANRYVAFYWGGMLVGRLVGVVLMKWIAPMKMLVINSLIAVCLILLSVNTHGQLAVWSLIAVGLFNSVLFGIIFSLSVRGLGAFTTQASGILSTAISGGAIVVLLQGVVIDHASWPVAFLIPVFCYAYIIFYGVNGYKSTRAGRL